MHFTNTRQEMEEFIAPDKIIKELEGEEDWDYNYTEPIPGENDKMKDTEIRDRLVANRSRLYTEWEQATLKWIQAPGGSDESKAIKEQRNEIAARLREDYWVVDPYLRARSSYDRIGVLRPDGTLNYYPEATAAAEAAEEKGKEKAEEKTEEKAEANGQANGQANGEVKAEINGEATKVNGTATPAAAEATAA